VGGCDEFNLDAYAFEFAGQPQINIDQYIFDPMFSSCARVGLEAKNWEVCNSNEKLGALGKCRDFAL
jgi:hypothetical protein